MAETEKTKQKDEDKPKTADESRPAEVDSNGEDKKAEEPLEKAPDGQMFIKVYSPFRSYYDALGTSITAANDTGPFDILVGHHKFLTLLSACEIEIKTADGVAFDKIKIDRGIMYVKEDRVTVFLDV